MPIPSSNEAKESIPEPIHQEVTEKDFEVFYREDASNISPARTLVEMSFEEKTPDLLALLTAHAGGSSLTVAVTPCPLTPIATSTSSAAMSTSSAAAANKKGKWGQGSKGSEDAEDGEVSEPIAKEAWTGKGQSKKPAHTRTSKEVGGDQPKKAFIWRPIFTLSSGNPVLDVANLRDPKKGSSGLVVECLEKVLCLLEDMAELRSLRKRKVFLALKQDLAKVHD